MTGLDFVQATSLPEAVALLNSPGVRARPIAGGTDLAVMMRQQGAWFDRLVDISAVPELLAIEEAGDEVRVGAAVTFAQAARSQLLLSAAPLLVEACLSVGSPQIRNAGTLGGNVANAATCADTLPPFVALEARAHIAAPTGTSAWPITELVVAPHRTALSEGSLITHFSFRRLPSGARSTFQKLGRRNAQAIARLSVAAIANLDPAGAISFIRVGVGAATPRAQRMTEVEALLLGQRPSRDLFSAAGFTAAEVMLSVTGRRWSTEYKEIAIQGLVETALSRVLGVAACG